jgi:hypothetical protein
MLGSCSHWFTRTAAAEGVGLGLFSFDSLKNLKKRAKPVMASPLGTYYVRVLCCPCRSKLWIACGCLVSLLCGGRSPDCVS